MAFENGASKGRRFEFTDVLWTVSYVMADFPRGAQKVCLLATFYSVDDTVGARPTVKLGDVAQFREHPSLLGKVRQNLR